MSKDYANWCLGMSQREEEQFHRAESLYPDNYPNTVFPDSHLSIQEKLYEDIKYNCTEDIGDDNQEAL